MAATTSTSCSSFFNLRSNSAESSRDRSSSKFDGLASWLINGVANAFFASLERCCIRIDTEDDVGEEANDAPLIFNDGNGQHVSGGGISRRREGKGKTKGASASFED